MLVRVQQRSARLRAALGALQPAAAATAAIVSHPQAGLRPEMARRMTPSPF